MNVNSKDFFNELYTQLVPAYEISEAKSMAYLLLEEICGINQTDVLIDKRMSIEDKSPFESALSQLIRGVPIQHILGFAWFMDRKFHVSKDVLIPRQETEELVHLILQENKHLEKRILDIGTGSGIIPISLKKEHSLFHVFGLDISKKALEVSRKNASAQSVDVSWIELDILNELPPENYDIIVSNPPYICHHEKSQMHVNVLEHDPEQALFVADDDPLLFYRRIGNLGKDLLNEGGKLYFELNERFGAETKSLIESLGYKSVMLHKDINGKDRMLSALK